jgi:hypothetical protein
MKVTEKGQVTVLLDILTRDPVLEDWDSTC